MVNRIIGKYVLKHEWCVQRFFLTNIRRDIKRGQSNEKKINKDKDQQRNMSGKENKWKKEMMKRKSKVEKRSACQI